MNKHIHTMDTKQTIRLSPHHPDYIRYVREHGVRLYDFPKRLITGFLHGVEDNGRIIVYGETMPLSGELTFMNRTDFRRDSLTDIYDHDPVLWKELVDEFLSQWEACEEAEKKENEAYATGMARLEEIRKAQQRRKNKKNK